MSIVNIPSPCSENVSDMAPRGNGFYCSSCTKVVVDFTQKTDAEILDYLYARNGERTCGFFRNDQVQHRSDWPFEWVRFVAALAMVFGSMLFMTSCHTSGESTDKQREDSLHKADSIAKVINDHQMVVGELGPPLPSHPKKTDSVTILVQPK